MQAIVVDLDAGDIPAKLDHVTRHLGAPTLTTLGKLGEQARRRRMSPYRLVLAWMLNKSPVSFVIPGARRPESVEDTAPAGAVELDADAVRAIENSLPTP